MARAEIKELESAQQEIEERLVMLMLPQVREANRKQCAS